MDINDTIKSMIDNAIPDAIRLMATKNRKLGDGEKATLTIKIADERIGENHHLDLDYTASRTSKIKESAEPVIIDERQLELGLDNDKIEARP